MSACSTVKFLQPGERSLAAEHGDYIEFVKLEESKSLDSTWESERYFARQSAGKS